MKKQIVLICMLWPISCRAMEPGKKEAVQKLEEKKVQADRAQSREEEKKRRAIVHEFIPVSDLVSIVEEYVRPGTFEPMFTLHSDDAVYVVNFNSDGSAIIMGDALGGVTIWNLLEDKLALDIGAHHYKVDDVSLSHNGKKIITSSKQEGAVLIWNAKTGTLIAEITPDPEDNVYTPMFNADDTLIAFATPTQVYIYDATTYALVKKITVVHTPSGHTQEINAVSFSPDGRYLLTVSAGEGMARIWNFQTGELIRVLQGPKFKHPIYMALFSPDGKKILTFGHDKTGRIWDIRTGIIEHALPVNDIILTANYNADGSLIVTPGKNNVIHIWQASDGALLQTLKGHTDTLFSVVFSRDGTKIASSSRDNTVRVWKQTPRRGKQKRAEKSAK